MNQLDSLTKLILSVEISSSEMYLFEAIVHDLVHHCRPDIHHCQATSKTVKH